MKKTITNLILLSLLAGSLYAQKNKDPHFILTIGDSNGALKDGWVTQLKTLMPGSFFINNSQSGRTIGFDNLGRSELNALANIDKWLDDAMKESAARKPDIIIVCLGTNDAKKDFEDRTCEVPGNLDGLLKKIRNHPFSKQARPKMIYVSPPPMRSSNMEAKYEGAT